MTSRPSNQHVGDAPSVPTPPEPSFAERVRTLLHLGRVGTLSTHSRKVPGFPFGSVAPYGLDDTGRPTFLISTMAMHTQNLAADGHASLLVTQPGWTEDPLAGARATLVGSVTPLPAADRTIVREDYLARHENARYWVDFDDFGFYRMEIVDLYYVAGFGAMGWVEAGDYCTAAPDPLADHAPGILAHMNADHRDALKLYCRAFAGVEADDATMTAVDRLGFRVRAQTGERLQGLRINFPRQVRMMLTGKPTLAAVIDAINRGEIQRFFLKPCDALELAASLARSLKEKDLLEQARRLLLEYRRGRARMEELEESNPGLTQVHTDDEGRFVLEDVPVDLDTLLAEMQSSLEHPAPAPVRRLSPP